MPISFNNYQPGTPEQVSPYANLVSNAMKNYQNAVTTKYAPQAAQADIFSKKFAPLAQIASNPLAMAMMGDKGQGIMDAIQQLLSQNGENNSGNPAGNVFNNLFGGSNNLNNGNGSSMGGGTNNPMPSGSGNNGNPPEPPDGTPEHQAWVNGSSGSGVGQAGAQGNNGYNPSLPQAGKDLPTSASAKSLAATQEQVHAGNTLFYDPNTHKSYAQPGENTIETNVQGINALRRVMPRFDKYVEQSQEFFKPESMFKTGASMGGGLVAKYLPGFGRFVPGLENKIGIDPNMISRYAEWQTNKMQMAKELLPAFPGIASSDQSLDYINSILEPLSGETTGYKPRVMNQLSVLNSKLLSMQQQMNPVPFTGNNSVQQNNTENPKNNPNIAESPPENTSWWMRPDKKRVAVYNSDENNAAALKNGFKRVK
jgi:hypothetical protein